MTSKLQNKIALITGASRGMGAAIAKKLAKDGASITITYATSPAKAEQVVAEIKAIGGKAIAIKADSGNTTEIIAAINQTIK
nr:SDR family NAD(P)-dependent oxidoreductase [Candidatus Paracaedibacter acanthamoebae]